MKTIPVNYIQESDEIKGIRENQSEEAIVRYMEKYESGTSKPILVKKVCEQAYILIDGHHRLDACKRLKKNKIDVEVIDCSEKELYSKAVEENLKHGVTLTKEEQEQILIKLVEQGKTQAEIGRVFGVGQTAIANRIRKNPSLVKSLSDKIKPASINEIFEGVKYDEIAKHYDISKGRVSQIWGNFQNELIEQYNKGITKKEILEAQQERGINLTAEKLNELIEEDYNKLIIGDCLKELSKIDDGVVDCLIIDPPYGIDYQSNRRKEKHSKIINDKDEAFDLLEKTLNISKQKLKKNSHIYIFTSWKVLDNVKPIVEKYFDIKNCLVWNKMHHGSGDLVGNYAEQYELILFAKQGKKKLCTDFRPINILEYSRTNNDEHPTQKPVDLLRELISNSTQQGELVLDCFAGSGSTLKAARQEGRKWIGIEIVDGDEVK